MTGEQRRIAVAGATGGVGRHVVDALTLAGHDVVAMSRAAGVDVVTGAGLESALRDVDVVVDASGVASTDQDTATAFFTASARSLQSAGQKAGVARLVVVSIIGVDRFHGGYYAAKAAHERELRRGPLPVRILRSAQFHELVEPMLTWGRRGDVSYVQEVRTQLVAARVVGQALAELATGPAEPDTPDSDEARTEIAGPRPESMVGAARLLAERRGDPVRVEAVSDPADPDTALLVGGALLPGPGAVLAGPTFEEWLDTSSTRG